MRISVFCVYCGNFFSAKFGGVASFGGTSGQSMEVCSAKSLFFTNSVKFYPAKVSRYMVFISNCMKLVVAGLAKFTGSWSINFPGTSPCVQLPGPFMKVWSIGCA